MSNGSEFRTEDEIRNVNVPMTMSRRQGCSGAAETYSHSVSPLYFLHCPIRRHQNNVQQIESQYEICLVYVVGSLRSYENR